MLTSAFDAFAAQEYAGISKDDAFERFVITQLRKPQEIATEEIEAGIVDGANDGGIDAFYVFVNGVVMTPDHPFLDTTTDAYSSLARNPRMEVLLVQAKNQASWKENAWEKVLSTLGNVLDLGKSDVELEKLYNSELVEATGMFRRAMRAFGPKFPKISFRAAYATRATEDSLQETVKIKADQVRAAIEGAVTGDSTVSVECVGAERLWDLASQSFGAPAKLVFRELVRESSSYLGVVSLKDYLEFIRDAETGSLREELFDANVRDFEGDNRVNSAISATLSEKGGVEFWWLNNGVTVLGDEVSGAQKALTISRPLIVNGLQTSHVLHRSAVEGALDKSRLEDGVVVRVIESTDESVRDRVIEGTNRQTPVPGGALFATDAYQIRLEQYLKLKGFYYERRKNRYKNLGMPVESRVSMSLLAQVMITALRGEPDQARARPSSILTRKGGYETVFPADISLDAYVVALQLLRATNAFLKTDQAKAILDESANTRFYVLAGYLLLRFKARTFDVANFALGFPLLKGVSEADLLVALRILARSAKRFQVRNPEMSRDSVFKNSDFRVKYLEAIGREVRTRKAAAKNGPSNKSSSKKTPTKAVGAAPKKPK